MTIEAAASEISYSCDGVTTSFAIPFPFDTSDDLKVILTDSSGTAAVLSSGYSVTGGGGSTGTLTTSTAYASGNTITVLDDPARTQDADYTDNDSFPADVHEAALDRNTRLSKRLYQLIKQCLRVSDGDPARDSGMVAPTVASRKGKFLRFNSTTGALEVADVSTTVGAISQSIIGALYRPQSTAEANASVVPSATYYDWGDVRRYGAVGDGTTDDTAAIQRAVNAHRLVYFPAGSYKITTTITITSGHRLYGEEISSGTIVNAWGCDAFTINGTAGSHPCIEFMQIVGYTALGVIDAKTNTAINCYGTAGNTINAFYGRRLYLRGWLRCVDWQYTWNSILDNVTTINCTTGLRLYGQSVNNAVIDCRLGANTGTQSILISKDGATTGEGLMVANSLLAEGTYGIKSDGFLALNLVNCIVDLITDKAFDLSGVAALCVSNSWIYAANYGISFAAAGSTYALGASISNCRIITTASGSRCLYFGANNVGASVVGGSMTCGAGTSRILYAESTAADIAITGSHFVNGGSAASLYSASSTVRRSNITGADTIEYASGQPAQRGVALATAAITGSTGASTQAFNCTTSRSATGTYTVTFSNAPSSASYVPMITARRTAKTSVVSEITSISASAFTFEVRDQAGTLFDPTDVFVAVFF